MSNAIKNKRAKAARRAHRVRAVIRGTAAMPRLTVKRSAKHIYAQLIDDGAGRTLAAASDRDVKGEMKPVELAKAVGAALAAKATTKSITRAVFDRGSYRYHGRVAALADGAREGGLTL